MAGRLKEKPKAAGTPLELAWIKFAPRSMRREYFAYVPGDAHGPAPSLESIDKLDRAAMRDALAKSALQLLEHANVIGPPVAWEMRRAVVAKLVAGKLLAFAIPVKPTPGLEPVHLPPSMLRLDYFKWGRSVVEGGGFTFRDVTVTRAERPAAKRSKSGPRTKSLDRPLRLRRSDMRRAAIEECFEKLACAPEPLPPTKTRVAATIRSQLRATHPELFPSGKGLDYKNIYRILKPNPNF